MSSPDTLAALITDVLATPRPYRIYPAPEPGDLVFEPMMLRRDRDAIGWLVSHDVAPEVVCSPLEHGVSGPLPETREVWDILSLNDGRTKRWENTDFFALPAAFAERARKLKEDLP